MSRFSTQLIRSDFVPCLRSPMSESGGQVPWFSWRKNSSMSPSFDWHDIYILLSNAVILQIKIKSLDPLRAKKDFHKLENKMGQTIQFRIINPRQWPFITGNESRENTLQRMFKCSRSTDQHKSKCGSK